MTIKLKVKPAQLIPIRFSFPQVFVAFAICVAFASCSQENKTSLQNSASSRGNGGVLQVSARIIEPKTLDNKVVSTGTIIANEEVELRSEINGRVLKIYFKEGGLVQKGQMLLKIDDAELQAQVKRNEFRLELAEDREKRQKKLFADKLISEEEYNLTLNELNVVKADLEILKAQLLKTEIRAPFSGSIGLRYVSEGSFITPSTRIAVLQNIESVKIDFAIPEKYSSIIQKGDEIKFKIAGSEKQYQGSVYAIEPKIESNTRSIQLRAIAANRSQTLFPGAFAEIELTLSQIKNAKMIPAEALVQELQGQKVFVLKSGKAKVRKVKTDIRTETEVQIVEGVEVGDTVFTSGILQMREDLPVSVISFN
ncbi:MAG: efflux RND transporter periplasmic adaptor subunit [Chloroherpetonaceae bacterium]|nr:efflux RND transporter periplasmic adaptor subunit [Chloroherpetonaceae bacterium]